MDTLEVSISRVITSLTQSLETSLHQSANTAAKNCLLTEEVCLSLGTECSLQKTSSSAANAKTISQCAVKCLACVILLYCYQARCTFTSLILTSYSVTRCLRSDHGYIDILRRFDASEVDVKAMSEHKHIALFQVWLDVFLVHICLKLIVDQDHDDISLFCSLCCGVYFKSLCLCFCPRLAALVKTNDNITSGLF